MDTRIPSPPSLTRTDHRILSPSEHVSLRLSIKTAKCTHSLTANLQSKYGSLGPVFNLHEPSRSQLDPQPRPSLSLQYPNTQSTISISYPTEIYKVLTRTVRASCCGPTRTGAGSYRRVLACSARSRRWKQRVSGVPVAGDRDVEDRNGLFRC